MSSMTDNQLVEEFDDDGVDGGNLNLRHTSFDDLRNALVSLTKTIQRRTKSFPPSVASIKPVDRELLAKVDSTIKLLEKFKWQIFTERVEEGQLQNKRLSDPSKRDSGISSARGSLRISQLESIEDEQDSTVSDSFIELNGETSDPSSSKEQTIIESEADNHVKAADNTSRSQQKHARHEIQLYQLTEVKRANGKSCYNFVPFDSSPAFNTPICHGTGNPLDKKHETEKELSNQVIHVFDSAAECRKWQEHNKSPNQCLRLAVSECNLRSPQGNWTSKQKTISEQQPISPDNDDTDQGKMAVFSLGSQSNEDICQQTAELYDPSNEIQDPSLTSMSQTGLSMNLLKAPSTKSLPSKLVELPDVGDFRRSEPTAITALQDIADRYRLEIWLTDNTCGFYDLHLSKPETSSESTEVKCIIGEEFELNVNVKEETRGVIAADKHGVKECNEKIPEREDIEQINTPSKHSNEDNDHPSISTSASECNILQHKLVKKT